ncbi:hypothetical protein NX794_03015 [Streptomyces sp. LP11]|uniref:BMP family ABC transporter substrate-binding protein n=1 Tax=Streptomyces pyxinicus TaxID=2970331 RepID=A0ABT2AWE6_9ACTN|nr:hypothetical protein [Streptomyces sp. LP11]MCS0600210.1 hypothetical protein [Streptomyces sp. LP11]
MAKQVRQVTQGRPAKAAAPSAGGRLAVVGRAAVAWLRALSGRAIALTAGAVAVVGALVVTGVLLSRHDDRPPVPDTRARHYTETDACLLTGENGITTGAAADVWRGMQDASLTTHARVSYAQVTGEQSTGNARPFLNGMLQRSCDVVLAVGKPEVTAAAQSASGYGKVGFVLVGGAHAGANVTTVGTGDGLRHDVAAAVERAVNGRV